LVVTPFVGGVELFNPEVLLELRCSNTQTKKVIGRNMQ
jgi:hypothetical protein